ncbi:MAG: hypothetical protein HUK14_08890 [Muribaculaceae bacterium]|nr:hypothetical protein [Muribaculaceae bacterium]
MADLDNKFIKADFDGASEMRGSVSSSHSVILALIDDIVRMQQNLDNMDISVKGVSQLRNRVKSMLTNLRSNGYEIAELIGRSVHEGDNMIGTWEPNEEMEPGTNRIKRVIRPQVSFKGKMIQAAEVVIEFNDK